MYLLVSDEAGNEDKQHQSIGSLLIEQDQHEELLTYLWAYFDQRELKFARVRKNDAYLQEAKKLLGVFFESLSQTEATLMTIYTKDSKNQSHDMYEELFLIAQSLADDEIKFTPDKNTNLQRWNHGKRLSQYWIVGIEEQDSEQNLIIQAMDIIAGITLFLREYHGTYLIRSQSTDRYEQMEEFERELHIRCELVSHFVSLLEKHYGKVTVLENGTWSVESERVVALEY